MVNDFMVRVDRIIASAACYQSSSVNGQREVDRISNSNVEATTNKNESVISVKSGNGEEEEEGRSSLKKKKKAVVEMVECRICQEEDDVLALEAPCACNGTLKFAHRKCVQRWCDKKGDITCEICNQVFSPNYSLPPTCSRSDVMAIDIRQAWGQHIDLRDSHLLALAAAEQQLLHYAVANTNSTACLRSVALILVIVLLLRQVLMVTRDMVQQSSTFFNFQVSLLQFAGFLLPCYVMARSWYIMQSQRRRHPMKLRIVNCMSERSFR